MPSVKLATSSEMLMSKIVRALSRKAEPLKTMDSARKEELADRAIYKIAQASMKQKRFDLKAAFRKFDVDGNGTVDKVEFVQIMQGFDPDVSEVEALAAFDRFDPSGDGAIDFQEFSYTFYNRRTFSESTKKLKRRRALGVTQRRQVGSFALAVIDKFLFCFPNSPSSSALPLFSFSLLLTLTGGRKEERTAEAHRGLLQQA